MVSPGQFGFAVFFFLLFLIVILISYRKDIKIHRKYYKNNFWVLIGFLFFVALLFLLKTFLQNK